MVGSWSWACPIGDSTLFTQLVQRAWREGGESATPSDWSTFPVTGSQILSLTGMFNL